MNKILVIIPYFGTLPNYFQAFLNSCRNTQLLDFLLITDDQTEYDYPDNYRVEEMSFQKLQALVQKKLGKQAYIKHPYKLCDYKSLYGYFFEDYTSGYGFWAHSDIDLIFGDIDPILEELNYTQYDRVFPYGHFSIYRNNDKMNRLFRKKLPSEFPKYFNIDFVKLTTYPCHFDEVGINIIIKEQGLPFFEENRHININLSYYNFSVGNGKHTNPRIICYDSGKLITVEKMIDGTFDEKNYLYVHLQGRQFSQNLAPTTDRYVISRDGFIDYADDQRELYFAKYGLNNNTAAQHEFVKNFVIKAKEGQKKKILRELKAYPMRGIYNIYHRYESIKYLKKHNLF